MIGTASGWGVVDPSNPKIQAKQLQKVNVKIMNMTDCKYSYPTFPSIVTPSMVCASADSADSCYGDSGGPDPKICDPRVATFLDMIQIFWYEV